MSVQHNLARFALAFELASPRGFLALAAQRVHADQLAHASATTTHHGEELHTAHAVEASTRLGPLLGGATCGETARTEARSRHRTRANGKRTSLTDDSDCGLVETKASSAFLPVPNGPQHHPTATTEADGPVLGATCKQNIGKCIVRRTVLKMTVLLTAMTKPSQDLDQETFAVAVASGVDGDNLVAGLAVASAQPSLAASASAQLDARRAVVGQASTANQTELAAFHVEDAVTLATPADHARPRAATSAAEFALHNLHALAIAHAVSVDRDEEGASLAVAAADTFTTATTVTNCGVRFEL